MTERLVAATFKTGVARLKNGRWVAVVQYSNGDIKPSSASFDREEDADAYRAIILAHLTEMVENMGGIAVTDPLAG